MSINSPVGWRTKTAQFDQGRVPLYYSLRDLPFEIAVPRLGLRQGEDGVSGGRVIHEARGLRTDVILFVSVQGIGRPGAFATILISGQPGEPSLESSIFGSNPYLF